MVETVSPGYDEYTARCPVLGHLLPFAYCKACTDGKPCRKIADCWFERMDIKGYLEERYSPEEIADILAPPKPKLHQIIEMARKASSKKD